MTEEEHWARGIVARHLDRRVEAHEDGTDSMFDLVVRADRGSIDFAIEVTQAMVESHRKQASALSGRRRIDITGNGWRWIAWLRPEASGNRARADIAALIAQFERMLEQAATADGSSGIDVIDSTGIRFADGSRANRVVLDAGPFEALQRLHIPTLIRGRATDSAPSTVSLEPMPGEAGLIDAGGTSLPTWISDFVAGEPEGPPKPSTP